MNKLVLTVGLLNYLTYAVVVRRHFSSATTPGAVRYGIIASCVGLAAFSYLMLRNEYTIAALVAALAIFAACLALFLWTASQHLRHPRRAGAYRSQRALDHKG